MVKENELLRYQEANKKCLENLANKRIFLIGSSGLLASALKDILSKANIQYVAYSRKTKTSLQTELLKFHPDYIIHLAAITDSKSMITEPISVLDTTLTTLTKALRFIKDYRTVDYNPKLVYISSIEAYGLLSTNKHVKETDLSMIDSSSVRSSYPISKLAAESYCKAYAEQLKIDTCCLRLSSVFGLYHTATDNRLYCQIVNHSLDSTDMILKSKGLTKKSVVYTLDAAYAILYTCLYGKSSSIYNFTNPSTYMTIKKQIKSIFKTLNKNCKIQYDVQSVSKTGYLPTVKFCQDISLFVKDIGFKPMTSLKSMFILEYNYRTEKLLRKEN